MNIIIETVYMTEW